MNPIFNELLSEGDNMSFLQESNLMDDTMNALAESVAESAFSEDAYIDGNDIEVPEDENDINKLQVFSQDHVGASVSDDALKSYDPDNQPDNSNGAFVQPGTETGMCKLVLGEDYVDVEPGEKLTVVDEPVLAESDEDADDFDEAELADFADDDEEDE